MRVGEAVQYVRLACTTPHPIYLQDTFLLTNILQHGGEDVKAGIEPHQHAARRRVALQRRRW